MCHIYVRLSPACSIQYVHTIVCFRERKERLACAHKSMPQPRLVLAYGNAQIAEWVCHRLEGDNLRDDAWHGILGSFRCYLASQDSSFLSPVAVNHVSESPGDCSRNCGGLHACPLDTLPVADLQSMHILHRENLPGQTQHHAIGGSGGGRREVSSKSGAKGGGVTGVNYKKCIRGRAHRFINTRMGAGAGGTCVMVVNVYRDGHWSEFVVSAFRQKAPMGCEHVVSASTGGASRAAGGGHCPLNHRSFGVP